MKTAIEIIVLLVLIPILLSTLLKDYEEYQETTYLFKLTAKNNELLQDTLKSKAEAAKQTAAFNEWKRQEDHEIYMLNKYGTTK